MDLRPGAPSGPRHAQGLLQGLSGAATLIAGLWAGLAWESGNGSGTVPLLISGLVSAAADVGLIAVGDRLE